MRRIATVSIDAGPGPDARREPRAPVSAEIPLRELGQGATQARLVNLSSRGFMAETKALISPGVRVWLTLPDQLRVNALVVWARDGRVGGEFAEPVDPLRVFQAVGIGAR
ncbi:MAG TPA: PilZ domain-containing protein [Allosphingosinicella sp.]|jgi:hypothetical protein|uniref:PilZ domain-containing protein n=1 Tax=Allosphingosinicella sp. TaxID=2823234 RepID=UPI002F2AF7F3